MTDGRHVVGRAPSSPGERRRAVLSARHFRQNGFMILTEIDHIAIAVRDLEAAIAYYAEAFGAEVHHREIVESDGVEEALVKVADSYIQLTAATRPDSPIAKSIEKRGEGVMLVSFNVDDTREAMTELEGKGYPFVGGARPFRDCEFAFIHPKKVNGVLLELIDYKWTELEEG